MTALLVYWSLLTPAAQWTLQHQYSTLHTSIIRHRQSPHHTYHLHSIKINTNDQRSYPHETSSDLSQHAHQNITTMNMDCRLHIFHETTSRLRMRKPAQYCSASLILPKQSQSRVTILKRVHHKDCDSNPKQTIWRFYTSVCKPENDGKLLLEKQH